MQESFKRYLQDKLDEMRKRGLYKEERIITGAQGAWIDVGGRQSKVLNMCANNYLGLACNPDIIRAAKESYDKWGYGLSSVRFICGTQSIHKELENRLSTFLGAEDTILYSSCFDANGGLFETILDEEDAVISADLNHASIIDGIRLCKAKRFRYASSDLNDLEEKLKQAGTCRFRLIATDGVFSMDGSVARLDGICELAEKYDAVVMVDDSHAVGILGKNGRGSHEHCNVMDRVDIITGTLGKALGGANGGYTSGRREIISILRQHSRPYLFSNTMAPSIVAASIKALELLENTGEKLRKRLMDNTRLFRCRMKDAGFDIKEGIHPIVPIMFYDADIAVNMSRLLLDKGVYVVAFSYPVVPIGQARIRVQISVEHSAEDIDFAVRMFKEAKNELPVYGD